MTLGFQIDTISVSSKNLGQVRISVFKKCLFHFFSCLFIKNINLIGQKEAFYQFYLMPNFHLQLVKKQIGRMSLINKLY